MKTIIDRIDYSGVWDISHSRGHHREIDKQLMKSMAFINRMEITAIDFHSKVFPLGATKTIATT